MADEELESLVVDLGTEEFQVIIKGQYEKHKAEALKLLDKMGILVDNVEKDTQLCTGTDYLYLGYTGEEIRLILNNVILTEFFQVADDEGLDVLSELINLSWKKVSEIYLPHQTDRPNGIGMKVKTEILNGEGGYRYDSFCMDYDVSSLTPKEELVELVDNLSAILAFWEYAALFYSYGVRKSMGLPVGEDDEEKPNYS